MQHEEVNAVNTQSLCKLALVAASAVALSAHADFKVNINAIDAKGAGPNLGTIAVSEAKDGGVVFTPALSGLSPGPHGFHVHVNPTCEAKEKDGKLEPGEGAGAHYDPGKSGKHAGPQGTGHKGDLPPLVADSTGNMKTAVVAPRLKLAELKNRALIIHVGGDNSTDEPANGGGGKRIACGVIK
jgi:superoxide dismutase, Cu-Zn family